MKPVRSHFYVPANKEDWVETAPEKYDADSIIFDLEDAVPPSGKDTARANLRAALGKPGPDDTVIQVRPNEVDSDHFETDLDAVVQPHLDVIFLPKVSSPEEIRTAESAVSDLEQARGIDPPIQFIVAPESARGLYRTYDLCTASDRVVAVVGATGKGGDLHRDVGYEFTRDGEERLHLLSKVTLDGKAAGIDELVGGVWMSIDDVEGLREEAKFLRQLGYTGMLTVHPDQIEPVNEIFSPDEEEVARAQRLVDAFNDAEGRGEGSIRFEGQLVDKAHVEAAKAVIRRAEAFGTVE